MSKRKNPLTDEQLTARDERAAQYKKVMDYRRQISTIGAQLFGVDDLGKISRGRLTEAVVKMNGMLQQADAAFQELTLDLFCENANHPRFKDYAGPQLSKLRRQKLERLSKKSDMNIEDVDSATAPTPENKERPANVTQQRQPKIPAGMVKCGECSGTGRKEFFECMCCDGRGYYRA